MGVKYYNMERGLKAESSCESRLKQNNLPLRCFIKMCYRRAAAGLHWTVSCLLKSNFFLQTTEYSVVHMHTINLTMAHHVTLRRKTFFNYYSSPLARQRQSSPSLSLLFSILRDAGLTSHTQGPLMVRAGSVSCQVISEQSVCLTLWGFCY